MLDLYNTLLVDHEAEPFNYSIKHIVLIFGYITHYGNMHNRTGVLWGSTASGKTSLQNFAKFI